MQGYQRLRNGVLSREEQQELGRRIKQGDKSAIHELVLSNVRFVGSMVRVMLRKGNFEAEHYDDMVGEGIVSLYRHAEDWDSENGCSFVMYAYKGLLADLRAARDEYIIFSGTGRPKDKRHYIFRMAMNTFRGYGIRPTLEDLETLTGLERPTLISYLGIHSRKGNHPIVDGEEQNPLEEIAATEIAKVDLDEHDREQLIEDFRAALESMTEVERSVLILRHTFGDRLNKTEVAKILKMDAGNSEGLYRKAMRKLRYFLAQHDPMLERYR